MNRKGERGVVLIAVLLAVAIMSVMVVAVTTLTRSGISAERLEERLLASRLALRSGLEGAKALIAATPPDQRMLFDGMPVEMDVGQGIRAQVMIRDAAGLADINRADMKLLTAVLSGALEPDVAESLSVQVEDLRKKVQEAQAAGGKDQSTLPGEPLAAQQQTSLTGINQPGAANQAADQAKPLPVVFASVDQMLALVPPEVISDAASQAIAASLTVFNPSARVNPFAAPPPLLRAVPGLTPQDAAAIDEARRNRAWKENGRIEQILERLNPFLAVEDPSVFMIGVRLIDGPGIIAQSSAGAVVQLLEGEGLPFRTLSVSGL
jgi:general secretion pathway protein K